MPRSARIPIAVPLILTCVLASRHTAAAPEQRPVDGAPLRGLSIEYADGKTSLLVLKAPGTESGLWTPYFPRIPGAQTSKGGLSLEALDLRYVVSADEVVVTVSLLYGREHQDRTQVAVVHVTSTSRVRVEALSANGVEPITMTIIAVPLTFTYLPVVTSVSQSLEVRVDPVAAGVPAYKLVFTNHSSTPVKAIGFEAYSGDTRAIIGRRRDVRSGAIVPSGGELSMTMPLSTHSFASDGRPAWLLWDRLSITFVLWGDGLVEGDQTIIAQERALDAEKARQLDVVLKTLSAARENGATTTEELRRQLNANPRRLSIGMQQVRDEALGDLDEFEQLASSKDRTVVSAWLTKEIDDYTAWLGRTDIPWANMPGR